MRDVYRAPSSTGFAYQVGIRCLGTYEFALSVLGRGP